MLVEYLQFYLSLVYKSSIYQGYVVIDGMLIDLNDSWHFNDILNLLSKVIYINWRMAHHIDMSNKLLKVVILLII